MRHAWKYVLGAYVLLVFAGSLASGSFVFLTLLIVAAAVVLGRRASGTGTLRLSWTSGQLPALTSAIATSSVAPLGEVTRFEDAKRELEPRFPENPLDSPQLVEILSGYTHEPADDRRTVEDEYEAYRRRFLAWRADVEALEHVGARPPGAQAERLDTELGELRRYAAELDRRAADSLGLLDRALDETGRAEDALARARAAQAALAPDQAEPWLRDRLDEAERKLVEARGMFAKGAERPVTALRLCREAVAAAREVEQQARARVELPRELGERRARFDAERLEVEQELARVKDDFQASAEMYAPSCWLEVRGAGAAADRALERARARWASASTELEAERLEAAAVQLEEAFGALARASELTGKIAAHLEALESAALSGRERIAQAEKEVDRAWTYVRALEPDERAPRELSLQRADELADRARTEIEKARPDWLTVTELAERSAELARTTRTGESRDRDPDPQLAELLENARTQAKTARDSACAWAIVSDLSPPVAAAIDSAEVAFQAAVRLEASIPAEASRPGQARALERAVDAFRSAERAARAAADEAERERSTRAEARVVGFGPAGAEATPAQALVWGALGLAALLAED